MSKESLHPSVNSGEPSLSEDLIPPRARALLEQGQQTAIPALAKDAALVHTIEQVVHRLPTEHQHPGALPLPRL